jgi:hypothetical protein
MVDETLAAIRNLYFTTTRKTIDRDFDSAIDLLKTMPLDERHRAAVFMEGLAAMRKEFKAATSRPSRSGGGPPAGRPRGRSDRP